MYHVHSLSVFRCVKFILFDDGRCVDRCSGEAEVRTDGPVQGNVCFRMLYQNI